MAKDIIFDIKAREEIKKGARPSAQSKIKNRNSKFRSPLGISIFGLGIFD